jgi:MFS family permease
MQQDQLIGYGRYSTGQENLDVTEESSPERAVAHAAPRSLVEVEYGLKLKLVAALSVTLIVSAMSQTVVSTAAQNIVADIGGFELFTWMFAGFSLSSAVAVPIVGKLADIHGTRPIISISLAIFLVSSAAAGAVTSMEQMIVARAFQGLGFAGVLGSVWVTTASMWEPRDRAKWLGALSASFTLAGVSGPILGGVLSDQVGWRWIFWFNLPVGGVALWLLLRWFPKLDRDRRQRKFDILGATGFALFAAPSLFALSLGGDAYPWDSAVILSLFGLATAAFILFVFAELRSPDPVLPLGLFRARVFSGAMAASLTITVTFVVATVFLPLLVIGARGQSATTSAFPLMTQAVGIAIGSNLVGQILSRWGFAREASAVGLGISALMLWWMAVGASDLSIAMLSFITLLMGIGISAAFTSFTVPIQNAMPGSVLGVVTTSLQFSRVLGMAIGSAALGAILLAQLAIVDVADPSPRQEIRDPEVVVSSKRLEEVHDRFLADPALGDAAYQTSLAESRNAISDALTTVFRIAAFASAAGVVLALITFSNMKPAKEEDLRLSGSG